MLFPAPWPPSRRSFLAALVLTAITAGVLGLSELFGPGLGRDVLRAAFALLVLAVVIKAVSSMSSAEQGLGHRSA